MKRSSLSTIGPILLAALLYGASAPLSKLLLRQVEPIPLAAFLYLGAGIEAGLFFTIQWLKGRGWSMEARLSRKDIPWMLGAVFAGGVAGPILQLIGLNHTTASTASLLLNFEGVATTLIAISLFKESVDKRVLWAVGLITLASILLTWTKGNLGISSGALAIIGACLLWGADNNFTRQISAKNPLIIVMIKGLGAGSFSLFLSIALGEPFPKLGPMIFALLVGGIIYGLSIQLFILSLRDLGAARTSAFFSTAPFIGAGLALLFLGDRPQGYFWAALPLMVFGAYLMVTEKHQHVHVHAAMDHNHAHDHLDGHHQHQHLDNEAPLASGKHSHLHHHDELAHDHPHLPDLHHRHLHSK